LHVLETGREITIPESPQEIGKNPQTILHLRNDQ